MSSREAFVALFRTSSEAIEFENQALSVGRDLLPPEAIAVLDDNSAEPTPTYWAWLIAQAQDSTR